MTDQAPDTGELTYTRVFDAPRELVFQAWTDPDHLAKWFGPAGFEMLAVKMDFRPGGVFLYGMRAPNGLEMWGKWVFRQIDAPEYLEFLQSFSDADGGIQRHPMAPGWPEEVLSTVRFTEEGGRTTLSMSGTPWNATEAEATLFRDSIGGMNQGWKGTLDAFDAYLAKVQQP